MEDNQRRLTLVGISFAGVVFVAPLIAASVRNAEPLALSQVVGAVAVGVGLLGGTALRRLGYLGHVGEGVTAAGSGLAAVIAFTNSTEMVSFGGLCVVYGLATASLAFVSWPFSLR